LRAAIEYVVGGIGGVVTLVEMGARDFALLLERWPVERAVQVARLLRAATQGMRFRHLGEDVSISVGVVPVHGSANVGEILAQAVRSCDSADRHGQSRIEVYKGHDT
jgi:GGDEF domain-containing protein